ncbi:MAG: 1,4-dihydroxy-2-naphthoate octaprenyltransferase, partial [Acidimicrobiia bacterium]
WMAFGVAAMAGAYLVAIAGWVIAAVGIASILATLGYVGGPFPYGYHGLGEVFVFVFFGPVATVSTRYVHADHAAPLAAWLLAIPVGLLVSAILVANNIRDLDTDRATGKRTLAVLIGRDRTRALYAALVWGTFVAVAIFGMAGWAPRATTLAALLAPLAVPLVRSARRATDGPTLVALLKGTARLHLVVGLALAATAIIG